jgi:dynein heavy chain
MNVLNGLNEQLEIVQKKLNDLLAAKRAMFPRFFFLSNEDLLEIIGQAMNPIAINKHIKKIYEGINSIKTDSSSQSKGVKMHVITKVVAEDGEELPVQEISSSHSLELNTNVESWMKNLTEASH